MAGALIVTVEIAQGDFSWLEGLRRAHYPSDRNQVPVHLTMFHALPPSVETELRGRLGRIVRRKPPSAVLAGLMDLGGGVAFRLVSPDLDAIRDELANELHGMLGSAWPRTMAVKAIDDRMLTKFCKSDSGAVET